MKLLQGQRVSVRDYKGRFVLQRVWSVENDRVFVTSEPVYELLLKGETDLWPIGVPVSDVGENEPTSISAA